MQGGTIDPPGWKRGAGYSHAIAIGDRLVVAGVLPWDPRTQEIEDTDFASQWGRVLDNLAELLGAAGFSPQEVVGLRIYVTDLAAYRAASPDLGAAWRRVFGHYFPAVTLVEVSGLVESAALIEVEADATRNGGS